MDRDNSLERLCGMTKENVLSSFSESLTLCDGWTGSHLHGIWGCQTGKSWQRCPIPVSVHTESPGDILGHSHAGVLHFRVTAKQMKPKTLSSVPLDTKPSTEKWSCVLFCCWEIQRAWEEENQSEKKMRIREEMLPKSVRGGFWKCQMCLFSHLQPNGHGHWGRCHLSGWGFKPTFNWAVPEQGGKKHYWNKFSAGKQGESRMVAQQDPTSLKYQERQGACGRSLSHFSCCLFLPFFLFPCIIRSVRNVCFLFLTTVSELFRSVLDVLKCLTEDVLIWTEGSWVLSWRNQMAFVSHRSWIMMFPQRSPKPFTSWPNFILRMQRRNWSRKSPSTCSSCRWESIHCYLTWGRGSQGQRAGQLHILVFISLQRDLSSATKTF